MIEGPIIPPQEYPLQKSYEYDVVTRKAYFHPQIAASVTFMFNREDRETFVGIFEEVLPKSDQKKLEAESFIYAAGGAWKVHRTDETKRDYVKAVLNEVWENLEGEKRLGKVLDFNPESDEIVKDTQKE